MNIIKMKEKNNWVKRLIIILVFLLPITDIHSQEQSILAGSSGADQLLINPWARSSGWAGANVASVRGLESMYNNVAGLAFTRKTELIFSRTSWLKYNDNEAVSYINSFGFSQKVGESGVISLGIMSLDFGDIEITTVELPDGGIGTFSPKFMNIGLSYAKIFSNSIYGGFTLRMITEQISDLSSGGLAFDAGIQYVTGKKDNLKFGISLKNVGPRMSYSGDGLSFRTNVATIFKSTVEQKSGEFELPSQLNIGITYDLLYLKHRITSAGTFTSNSFQKDQYRLGLEYAFRDMFMLRAGYTYEKGIQYSPSYASINNKDSYRTTALRGPSAGFTFEIPMGDGKTFGLDYSYLHTDPFQGCHSLGARINL